MFNLPWLKTWLISACLALSFFSANVFAIRSPVSVRADIWYPYTGSEYSEKPGYIIELLAKILEPSDYRLEYATMSWRRAVDLTRFNYYDCIAGADPGDVPDFIFTETPFGMVTLKFFVRKGASWQFKSIDHLKTMRLGVTRDYSYDAGPLDAYIKENPDKNITLVSKEDPIGVLIDLLAKGEIDTFVDAELAVKRRLQEKNLSEQFQSAGDLGQASPIFVACGPTNTRARALVALFDEGLKRLRFNGEYQRILDRYEVADWEKKEP